MARIHVTTDAQTGKTTTVPFTPEEEKAADDLVIVTEAPKRDPLAEIDALKALLVARMGRLTQ